jgi:hypothetical protein
MNLPAPPPPPNPPAHAGVPPMTTTSTVAAKMPFLDLEVNVSDSFASPVS